MSRFFSRNLLLTVFVSLFFVQSVAQKPPTQPSSNPNSPLNSGSQSSTVNPYALPPDSQFNQQRNERDQPSDAEIKLRKDHDKQINKDRFEALKKDTIKLLALANELKTNVDKSSEETLSLDVIKKTEEIEKLAKSVREKMIAK